MRPARLRGQDGFTMVEVLVALGIFMLIVVGILQIFEPSNAANLTSQRKLSVQQNGRVAMDTIVRQIRMAGFFPENFDADNANNVANSVQIATNAALAVAGDLDGSGASNAFLFCHDGTALRRIRGAIGAAASYTCAGGDILAESVTSLGFAYYDGASAPVPNPPAAPYALDAQPAGGVPDFTDTTQRSSVRRVVITLTARESVPNQPAQTYTLTSDVRLRNP